MSLPTVTIIGNMKRIEMKYTQSGKAVTKFQIECAEKNAKGEWTNLYLSGECWEKSAEFVNQYFNDGSPAIVTGKLYTNVYENKEGKKVYENKLLFPNVSFVPKDKSGNQEQAPQQQQNYGQQNQVSNYSENPNSSNKSPQQQQQNHTSYQQPQQAQQMPQQTMAIDVDPNDEIPF